MYFHQSLNGWEEEIHLIHEGEIPKISMTVVLKINNQGSCSYTRKAKGITLSILALTPQSTHSKTNLKYTHACVYISRSCTYFSTWLVITITVTITRQRLYWVTCLGSALVGQLRKADNKSLQDGHKYIRVKETHHTGPRHWTKANIRIHACCNVFIFHESLVGSCLFFIFIFLFLSSGFTCPFCIICHLSTEI